MAAATVSESTKLFSSSSDSSHGSTFSLSLCRFLSFLRFFLYILVLWSDSTSRFPPFTAISTRRRMGSSDSSLSPFSFLIEQFGKLDATTSTSSSSRLVLLDHD